MSEQAEILSGYVPQEDFARANRISTRTVARYRSQSDGLPYVEFGGKVFIPLREAGDWLRDRIIHPNRRRTG
jgi:hypothetical protein